MDALTREPIEVLSPPRSRRWVMVLLSLLVLVGIAAAIWFWPSGSAQQAARNRNANQPIPVLVATAVQKDVPLYLEGLGTVQAFNTVTIKPMVDGPLLTVNFREGQMVKQGDLLAQIDPRTYQAALDQATAKKAQDEALLANARLDLTRYQKLVANNYAPAQQADTSKSLVAQLEAQVRQDQAQIDTARTQLSYTTIVSPLDGRTGMRQVDAGNIVHASDATGLVMLTQLQPISVMFTLPQQSLPAVAAAMRQGTPPKAIAYTQSAAGTPAAVLDTGTLAVLDNQVDPTTGTIKLKATFPNADEKLWPGAFVGVRLQVDVAQNAVVVPPAAVQRGPRSSYVYVVNADNTSTRHDVTVGHEDAQGSIITKGVAGGDKVVVDGAERLSDGTKVTIVPPAASSAPTADQPAAPGTRRRQAGAAG